MKTGPAHVTRAHTAKNSKAYMLLTGVKIGKILVKI